jgi:mannose-6-phosphate isomerase-like protein (cupin superfamily)
MNMVSAFGVLSVSVALVSVIGCAKDTAEPEPAVQAGSATTTAQSPVLRGPRRAVISRGSRPMPGMGQIASGAPAEAASAAPPPAPPPFAAPPAAAFVDVVASKGSPVALHGCDEVAIAVASGKLTMLGETLGAGDVLLAHGEGSFDMKGAGLVVVARVVPKACTPAAAIDKRVVRGTVAQPLVWGHGAMTAHLDVDERTSPDLYVGRLEGTAPVAEHVHAGVYEILCVVQAAGVLMVDGRPQAVGPKTCTVIPPDTKHAWVPASGARLVAIQMYAPPGPEQRFKKLAADEANAAAPGDGG